ncbi:hypothetical protein IGJ55_003019 [Enterococcus sp. AZ170]
MNWINKANLSDNLITRDTCVVKGCWTNNEGGACLIKYCVTRFCFMDY